MDKWNIIVLGGLLSKPLVDVARDDKVFIVVVGLIGGGSGEWLQWIIYKGLNRNRRYGYFVYWGWVIAETG